MQTEFDKVLEKVRAVADEPKAQDEAHLEFYQSFFDTTFYLPVAEKPDLEADDMELSPLVVEEEGEEVIYFFDSEERLKEWVGDEQLFIAPLTGEDLLLTFGPERMMVLNPHLEQSKEFSTDEIEFLFDTFFEEGEDL